MLYYQFAVAPARTHENFAQLGYGIASVMLRLDEEDISACTRRAVDYLSGEHWRIIEIREARLIDPDESFGDDERLAQLYAEAQIYGIAGTLVAPGAGVYTLKSPAAGSAAAA